MSRSKQTKIVCTIGPASDSPETLERMIGGGMNVARLNFSHGEHSYHAGLIKTLRQLSAQVGQPIAVLQDLQGPKVRCGKLPKEGVELVADEKIILSTASDAALPKIPVDYQQLHEDVSAGDRILLDDGLLELKVESVTGQEIACQVVVGGKLTSNKGINVPTATLQVPAITEKDERDARFGVEQRVDWMALSFVRSAKEVFDLRY